MKTITKGNASICDHKASQLTSEFHPTDMHVICGKGNHVYNHKGNVRFRLTVAISVESYIAAPNRYMKSAIVEKIVKSIGPTMVRQDTVTKRWYFLGQKDSREKVGQVMRMMVSKIQSSDIKSERKKRRDSSLAKTASSPKENNSVDLWSSPSRPLSSQSSEAMHAFEKVVRPAEETSVTWPDSAALRSSAPLLSKDLCVHPDDVISNTPPIVLCPDEVLSSVPPCLSQQSSTDWFDDKDMDLSAEDLENMELFADFFETFASAPSSN
jgi:hypothetical protein